MMKYLPLLSIITVFIGGFMASCAESDPEKKATRQVREVVVFDDGYNLSESGEVLLDDQDYRGRTLATATTQSELATRTAQDGSQIKIMDDGHGNRTITRFFYNDPVISGVVSRVSKGGKIDTYVYTRDGLVKNIKTALSGMLETATAREIAQRIGIDSLSQKQPPTQLAAIREQPGRGELSPDRISEPVAVNQQNYQAKDAPQTEAPPVLKDNPPLPETAPPASPAVINSIPLSNGKTYLDEFDKQAKIKNK